MITRPPPPDRHRLDAASIHIWAVELDDASFDATRALKLLSADEQSRSAKFVFERDRRRYAMAHTALRRILAGYLGTDAADLQFVAGENGKPSLAAIFAGAGVQFNLSHSHECALIAVAQRQDVGVDIEFVKADFSFAEVAERFFTAKEVAALRALPVHLQCHAFYKCWTSKEAFLKAKGTGLSGKLDEVEIALDNDDRVRIGARVPGWSLAELSPGEGYEGAVVLAGDAGRIQTYRWQPSD